MRIKLLPLFIVFILLSFQGIGESNFNEFSKFNKTFEKPLEIEQSAALMNANSSGEYYYYLPPLWFNYSYANPRYLYMYTSYDSTEVHIYTADSSISINKTVFKGTPLVEGANTYMLSKNYNTVEDNKGIIIKSSTPFYILFSIVNFGNSQAVSAKGNHSLGQEFMVHTAINTDVDFSKGEVHFATVMATEDNTTINFDNNGNNLRGLNSSTHQVTLNKGETFMVLPDENDNERFDGLEITSDKNIVVNSGEMHPQMSNSAYTEGGATQLVPTDRLGKEYIIARGLGIANSGDYALVVATENNTKVNLNGSYTGTTLNKGEFYEVQLSGQVGKPYYIQTNKNSYVYHYCALLGEEVGTTVVPPIDSAGGTKYVDAYNANQTFDIIFIYITDNALTSLKLADAHYSTYSGISVTAVTGKPGWNAVYIPKTELASGVNTIEADEPFHIAYLSAVEFFGSGRGSGFYEFFSPYNDLVNVTDPNNPNVFVSYYLAGSVALGDMFYHSLDISSVVGGGSIMSASARFGTATYSGSNLSYEPPLDFCGLDSIDVVVTDTDGNTSTVTVAVNVDSRPVAVSDTFANTGVAQALDVLHQGDADYDPASCDQIKIVSAGTNGIDAVTERGGSVSVNDNATPNDPTDDFIDYVPNGVNIDSFRYVISDIKGNLDTAIAYMFLASEICGNSIDDDGDNLTDCEDPDCGPAIDDVVSTNVSTCNGNDGTITISVSGGNGTGHEYSIDSGETWFTYNNHTNLTGGTYYIAVRNEGDGSCPSFYANNPIGITAPSTIHISNINAHTVCGNTGGSIQIEAIQEGINCDCTKNFKEVVVRYNGPTGGTVKVYDENQVLLGTVPGLILNGAILHIVASDFGLSEFKNKLYLEVNNSGNYREILTDCSIHIIGETYGEFKVLAYTDKNANTCNASFIEPNNCDDNRKEVTIKYWGGDGETLTIEDGYHIVIGQITNVNKGDILHLRASDFGQADFKDHIHIRNLNGVDTRIELKCNNYKLGHLIGDYYVASFLDGNDNFFTEVVSDSLIQYSIDNGSTFQYPDSFLNVSSGTYDIVVQSVGTICQTAGTWQPIINDLASPVLSSVVAEDVTCKINDGKITITPTTNETFLYSIDNGANWYQDSIFSDLTKGDYNVMIANLDTLCHEWYASNPVKINLNTEKDSLELKSFYDNNNGSNWDYSTYAYNYETYMYGNGSAYIPNYGHPWNFNTSMDTWHGVTTDANGCVSTLKLVDMNITGTLPDFDLPSLISLRIGLNPMSNTGTIPNFSKMPKLTHLSLRANNLTGIVPDFLNLPDLVFFEADYNYLTGIPNFSNLHNLIELDLDHNNITGTIPDFASFGNAQSIHIDQNQLTGGLPDFTNLGNIRHLYFHTNNLDGNIPDYSDNLPFLQYLMIDNNNLTFEDLVGSFSSNNIHVSGYYRYSPQSNFGINDTTYVAIGETHTIDLGIDPLVTTSSYAWERNGNPLVPPTTNNKRVLNNITSSDTGTYEVVVVNSLVPGLTLHSAKYSVLFYNDEICGNGNDDDGDGDTDCADTDCGPTISSVISSDITNCNITDGTITITGADGSGNYEYSINNGFTWETTSTYTGLAAGSYNVMIRNVDGTCPASYVNNPMQITTPIAPIINSVSANNSTGCDLNNGSIIINITNGSLSPEYSIDNGVNWQNNGSFSNLAPGTYNVQVRNLDETCVATYGSNPIIIVEAPMLVSISSVNPTGCNEVDGSITVTGTNGNGNYEFSIDNGGNWQASNTFPSLGGGIYTIKARNANGTCETAYGSNPVILTPAQITNLTVSSIGASDCSTSSGQFSMGASGGIGSYEFSIDNGESWQASGQFPGLSTGLYYPKVRNSDGSCPTNGGIVNAAINAPNTPHVLVSVTNMSDCSLDDGTITMFPSGGLTPYQYSIDSGNTWITNTTINNLTAGDYHVFIKNNDGSCIMPYFSNPVTINSPNPFPIIEDVVVSSSSSCGTNDGTITISASGGSGSLEYSIDGGSTWNTNNNFTGQAAGSYNVYVRNSISPNCARAYTNNPVTVAAPTTQDSLGLVHIYNNNGGASSSWTYSATTYDAFGTTYPVPNHNTPWDLSTPFNTWHGIQVDGNGCVEKIVLNDNGLTDNVPNISLGAVKHIYLQDNNLTGSLPNFSGISSVRNLNLDNNSITGSIPNFANFPNLVRLRIANNQLDNSLPLFNNMPNLLVLELENNNITGSIPDFTLPALKKFQINNNELAGSIPDFTGLPNVEVLRLSHNNLSGIVPNFSDNLLFLNDLEIEENQYTFEDLEPHYTANNNHINLNAINPPSDNYFYTPQAKFGVSDTTYVSVGGSHTINLNIDLGVSSNTYSWYLDGTFVESTMGVPALTLSNIMAADTGRYTVEVVNSNVLALTLYSVDYYVNFYTTEICGNGQDDDGDTFVDCADSDCGPTIVNINSNDETACATNDGSIEITATLGSGAYEYSIDSGNIWQTSNMFSNLSSGIYHCFVRNAADDSCPFTDSSNPITINSNVPRVASVTPSNVTSCGATDGSIAIMGVGGIGSYEFSIDGGISWQVSNSFSGLDAGSYNVYIKNSDGSCPSAYANNPVKIYTDRTSDSLALVNLYNFNNGANWSYSANTFNCITTTCSVPNDGNAWDFNTPIDTWHGVSVNAAGCVTTLALNDVGLTGTLGNINLPMLESLTLDGNNNNLTGALPDMSTNPNLTYLNLGDNGFSGAIPNYNLPNLQKLDLDGNNLTGSIPNFTGLPNLINIDLDDNELTGSLPTFQYSPLLEVIDVDHNQLSEVVPNYSTYLPNLENLEIQHNNFTLGNILEHFTANETLIANNSNLSQFKYSPQDPFGVSDSTITVAAAGMSLTINLGIDAGVTTNVYEWYFNGTLIATTNEPFYTIPNFSAANIGSYSASITNPLLPNITLNSPNYTATFSSTEDCSNGLDDDGDGLIDNYDGDCPSFLIPTDTAYTYFIPSIWKDNNRFSPGNLKITTAYDFVNVTVRTANGTTLNQTTTVSKGTPVEINTEVLQSQDVNTVQNDEGLIITSDFPIQCIL